ncbi:hypothetical protein B0I37DRAFT_114499 [Chaetomium sp. MPI-CAGE-AT-0009]|nr:hypothetical protein B0I37DRAFT_114499 [Chaetomium sp. MPI-CAGE-AT-0009]
MADAGWLPKSSLSARDKPSKPPNKESIGSRRCRFSLGCNRWRTGRAMQRTFPPRLRSTPPRVPSPQNLQSRVRTGIPTGAINEEIVPNVQVPTTSGPMAGPGGADDDSAHLADPVRVDGPSSINSTLQEHWDPVEHELKRLVGRLEKLPPSHGADVSELRQEVKELGDRVEALRTSIRELRETVAKAEKMESKQWQTNNERLEELYQAVILERQPSEIPRPQQNTRTTRRSEDSPGGVLRKLFCMG